MDIKQRPKTFQLIQNSFSTLLLDAIQYFPASKKRFQGETHGLLFGVGKDDEMVECDYVFPVGNVKSRTSNTIEYDPKIDMAITSARSLLATSKFVGTYHSHPNKEYFFEWAYPSNMDISFADYVKDPAMIIIALTRSGKLKQELQLEVRKDRAYQFTYNPKLDGHDLPDQVELGYDISYLFGSFLEYTFEMRAYCYNSKSLLNMNLFSSEAELLNQLGQNKIKVDTLSASDVFRLRKIEYNLRENNERRGKNTEYHLERLKPMDN
ncbi:MAG: Mov34/MPN/PAD-1 family protein [Paenibacillus sp.]|uniref:Mov34/MPN/PAD-1 family protein n=1 Tax=Paenibacillus sp. TaxID=58172 RepID=UPI002903A04C|nr:Mov34/MPN/PAD-1 family protein [Paenibacillus sp.]MDU2241077.1 Mov34/MPN/PAD-1 family protein [Paenibacillus sp.]